jgi:hypothetical protein
MVRGDALAEGVVMSPVCRALIEAVREAGGDDPGPGDRLESVGIDSLGVLDLSFRLEKKFRAPAGFFDRAFTDLPGTASVGDFAAEAERKLRGAGYAWDDNDPSVVYAAGGEEINLAG